MVTGTQYSRLVANQQRPAPEPVLQSRGVQALLRQAARSVRRRARARELLGALLDDGCLAAVRVERLEEGTLTLAVENPAVLARLQRQGRALEKRLADGLPGLRRLRLVFTSAAAGKGPEGRRTPGLGG